MGGMRHLLSVMSQCDTQCVINVWTS